MFSVINEINKEFGGNYSIKKGNFPKREDFVRETITMLAKQIGPDFKIRVKIDSNPYGGLFARSYGKKAGIVYTPSFALYDLDEIP